MRFLLLFFFTSLCFAQSGKVIKIKDGDTIVILDENKNQHTIRVAAVDCPENGQPYSKKARNFVSGEIFGNNVSIEKVSNDRYGRIVGFVHYDNKNLSLELLKNGFAWHYKYFSDDEEMSDLENEARLNKIGLWNDPYPINPYDWRKGERPDYN